MSRAVFFIIFAAQVVVRQKRKPTDLHSKHRVNER